MPFASTSLGAEQPLLNSELLGYGRDPLAPIKDAVKAEDDVIVPMDAEAVSVGKCAARRCSRPFGQKPVAPGNSWNRT